jgi:hypothetical protein
MASSNKSFIRAPNSNRVLAIYQALPLARTELEPLLAANEKPSTRENLKLVLGYCQLPAPVDAPLQDRMSDILLARRYKGMTQSKEV